MTTTSPASRSWIGYLQAGKPWWHMPPSARGAPACRGPLDPVLPGSPVSPSATAAESSSAAFSAVATAAAAAAAAAAGPFYTSLTAGLSNRAHFRLRVVDRSSVAGSCGVLEATAENPESGDAGDADGGG